MFDSHLYSPDGSSVLLAGVVGGATGISTPGENMKERSLSLLRDNKIR